MKKILLLSVVLFMAAMPLAADEGLWLPSLIGTRIKDMKSKGFRLSAEDIYSINKASLKDAIVMFGRGCSGELVSAEGLLFTNHHCGYGQIQQHSSVEHDYLTDGFWAMNRSEELPNPGLTVSFLIRMEDVTDEVLAGVTEETGEQQRREIAGRNSSEIIARAVQDGRYSASVESLYYGNQYFLFVYEVFRDVRLVGAPPSAIGKFGGDTDNWMWPRHTGDFSVFRIYADRDNRPADYAADNVPYRPRKFFEISTGGIEAGDFTFVYGFPGTTREYVTSDFIDYTLNHSNPAKIALRSMRLDIMKAAQERDPATRIMYASKVAGIANAWKKWEGESLGLARLGTLERKRYEESIFQGWADGKNYVIDPVSSKPHILRMGKARVYHEYQDILPQLHEAYAELLPYAMARDYYMEAVLAVELANAALSLRSYAASMESVSGVEATETARRNLKAMFEGFYKNYSTAIDRQVAGRVMERYMEAAPREFVPESFMADVATAGGLEACLDKIFAGSALVSAERFDELLSLEGGEFQAAVAGDPAVEFVTAFSAVYSDKITGPYASLNERIDELYRTYMRGVMECGQGSVAPTDFYPDANMTLRVAYGEVEGYKAADGVCHNYMTTLDGIIEKDNPAIYDYDVPQKLRDIYCSGDYGRWGINVGTRREPHYTVPVAFLATNHTAGGNSGSPLLNGRGQLVGINFDRTWLSTMSDLEFDPEICRNISVDIRYVLFVIDKVGGAGYLLDEMRLK